MRRREFITLLGGAAAAWPTCGAGAAADKLATIGFPGRADTPAAAHGSPLCAAAARTRLDRGPHRRDRGSLGGGTLRAFRRDRRRVCPAQGRCHFTAEPPVFAAKQATSVIPIVFATVADPLGSGLVASLARPGGNVTGLSLTSPDLAGKRFELLREAVAGLRRLAVMTNGDYPPAVRELEEVETAARPLGIETIALKIRQAADIAPAFESLQGRADALYVFGESLTAANQVRISSFALATRLPTMNPNRERLEVGGLMSYGPNFPSHYRRSADLVDKILRGAKPADIPVEQPTKFDFVINLTTARAIGLKIPEAILLRADELIE